MKLLHVITSLEIGGAQRLLSELLPLQKKQGIDVSLLVNFQINNAFSYIISEAGIRIISLEEHNIHSLTNIWRLRKIFKGYDVVHVHLFPSLYWAAIAAIGLSVKLVYTEHSTTNRRRNKKYFRHIERFIYNKYDKVISISEQTKIALQRWLGYNDGRHLVICNGIDIEKFMSIRKPIIPKSLIMISRFASSKDQETVIKAMKYIDSDAILRFVGDGENMNHCKAIAEYEGVGDRVRFLGAQSHVAELIAESYIGIQSSNWEGFGLTAVEIMACGKPIVVTNVDGLKQVVNNAGLLFDVGDVMQLATHINALLSNRDLYNELAVKSIIQAKKYDINNMAKHYCNLYNSLL